MISCLRMLTSFSFTKSRLTTILTSRIGEGFLNRRISPLDDLADLAAVEHLDRVVGGVGLAQLVVGQRQHPGDVHRDVAVADHHGALAATRSNSSSGVVGVGVVPADERGGGVAARAGPRPGSPSRRSVSQPTVKTIAW